MGVNGLCQNLVDSAVDGSSNVALICVASNCADKRLLDLLLVKVLPDLPGGLVTIHYWHVAVHHDVAEAWWFEIVVFYILFDDIYSFLTVECFAANCLSVNVESELENDI